MELAIKEGVWRAVQQRLKTECRPPDTRRTGHSSVRSRHHPDRPIGRYAVPPQAQVPLRAGQWDDRDAGNGRPRA